MDDSLISRIIFPLLSMFLLVDAINGFFLLSVGIDFKISVLYKGLLLSLLIVYLLIYKPSNVLLIFGFCLLLILGETVTVLMLQSSAKMTGFLMQHVVKIVSPLLLLCFLLHRELSDQRFFHRINIVFRANCLIFLGNILAGIFGYGYSTYGGSVDSGTIGVKGFFYAGNEISAILVVFAGLYLGKSYAKSKLLFLLAAIFWALVGFAISTKTAILAVMILVMATPLLYEGKRIWRLNNPPSLIFLAALVFALFQSYSLYLIFKETALYGRMDFFFRNHGIIGVILSGRDLYLESMWQNFVRSVSIFNMLFGYGISYYADQMVYSAELDFADMFFWHGIIGVLISITIFAALSIYALMHCAKKHYPFAKTVLMTNLMLLFIANLSGHIFTSGMLAFLWPCFAMMAKYSWLDEPSTNKATRRIR